MKGKGDVLSIEVMLYQNFELQFYLSEMWHSLIGSARLCCAIHASVTKVTFMH